MIDTKMFENLKPEVIKEVANNADALSKLSTSAEVDKAVLQQPGEGNGGPCSCCAPSIVRVKNLMSTVTINMKNADCCCPPDQARVDS